ncbi:MAG: hypothetical protein ACREDT_01570 [Methylocella sp.]
MKHLTQAAPAVISWLNEGEKYALVGLKVKLDEDIPLTQLTLRHWIAADPGFTIPGHWREWLGSLRTEELDGVNLFLISRMPSDRPEVLDDENQLLTRLVSNFYTGLLLSSNFSPAYRPVMLTGSRRNGEIDIRSQSDWDTPIPHSIHRYPAILKPEIESAAHLAAALERARADAPNRSYWRFFRTLALYTEARTIRDNLERLHQYCRCIEGLILASPGDTKRQFKSRTELFIGPRHHDMMGEMYDVRSAVEHLHEQRYLEQFERDVRLGLLQKEVVAEHIARTCLARIAGNDAILHHFANSSALSEFWTLPAAERSKIWGDPINPMDALAGYSPRYISDGELGGP